MGEDMVVVTEVVVVETTGEGTVTTTEGRVKVVVDMVSGILAVLVSLAVTIPIEEVIGVRVQSLGSFLFHYNIYTYI